MRNSSAKPTTVLDLVSGRDGGFGHHKWPEFNGTPEQIGKCCFYWKLLQVPSSVLSLIVATAKKET